MTTTPRIVMTRVVEGQSGGEVLHNDALNRLDVFVGMTVKSRDTTTPPGSPAEGDAYLLPASGCTGAWAGLDGQIVTYFAGWISIPAFKGLKIYVESEDTTIRYVGTKWVGDRGSGQTLQSYHHQIGTTPSQRYIAAGSMGCNAMTTLTVASGTLYLIPFVYGRGCILDKLYVYPTSASPPNVRIGIFDTISDVDIRPNNNLYDSGSVAETINTLSGVTGLSIRLTPGKLYWFGVTFNGTPTVRAVPLANVVNVLGLDNTLQNPATMWTTTWTFATAFGNISGSSFTYSTGTPPAIAMSISG